MLITMLRIYLNLNRFFQSSTSTNSRVKEANNLGDKDE